MAVKLGTRIRRKTVSIPLSSPQKEGRFYEAVINGITGDVIQWNPGTQYLFTPDAKYQSAVVTQDEVHSGPPYKEGGMFYSSSYTNEYDPSGILGARSYENNAQIIINGLPRRMCTRKYVGGFAPPTDLSFGMETNLGTILAIGPTTVPSLDSWGDKAWSRTKPNLEKASAFVFVAELRDIPRMLKTTAAGFHGSWMQLRGSERSWSMAPKKAADQFLNYQFGWAPFLRDIASFHKVVENYTAYLENLSRLNGRSLRRRVPLSEESTVTVLSQGSGYPNAFAAQSGGQSDWFSAVPTWSWTEELTTSVYAVGRWRYYSPAFDVAMADYAGRWKEIRRFMTLFGLRVSPSNVYKAIPWTWLVDWVSNLGDQVELISDELMDEKVAQYLYVMQHTIRRRKFTRVLPFRSGPITLQWSRVIETKTRQAAQSPYGFSLSWDFLDPRKLMILGALGISRHGPW